MKNNNKNRKLKFIREKNNLRRGITKFYCTEKVDSSFICDEAYWERLIYIVKKSLLKNWKLKLKTIKISNGLCDNDFVKDLITNRVELSR